MKIDRHLIFYVLQKDNKKNLSLKKKTFNFLCFLETGWAITSTCIGMGMNLKPPAGSAGKAVPGWNGKLLPLQYHRLLIFY